MPLRSTLTPDQILNGDQHPFKIQGQAPNWQGFLDRMTDAAYVTEHVSDRDGVHPLSSLPVLPLAKMIGFFGGDCVPAVQARLGALVYCAMTGTSNPTPTQWLVFELAATLYQGGTTISGNEVGIPAQTRQAFDAYLQAFKQMGMPYQEDVVTLENVVQFMGSFDMAYQRAMKARRAQEQKLIIKVT